jgi:methionyl-tRNA synthetase
MFNLWNGIRIAAVLLYPFMPVKSQLIWKALGMGKQIETSSLEEEMRFYTPSDIAPIDKIPPIFPRIEEKV